MENPFSSFFLIEERSDGIYARIDKNKRLPSIAEISEVLEKAMVINYTASQLEKILPNLSKLQFQRVGPAVEFYNAEIEKYLSVNITAKKAEVKINSAIQKIWPSKLSVTEFQIALKRKGVLFGINEEGVIKLANEPLYDKYITVAEAKLPVNGENAKIEMMVSIVPTAKPSLRNDGSVDFREIQSFTPVTLDQQLAKKISPTKGVQGVAVNGEPLLPEAGKDIPLPVGKNTKVSDDGLYLLATKPGIVIRENNQIQVVEVLKVNGDVDFSVGNVKYSGDVQINGNVLPGFTVETEGNILIKGEVESARIVSRSGDVVISKGVLGKGDTVIIAKKGIHVTFAQEAQLKTDGVITVGKYLLNCNCECKYMDAEGSSASIVGGVVRAEHHILARQLGNEQGIKTIAVIFDKFKLQCEEKIKQLKELEQKLLKELEPIDKQLRTKTAILKKSGAEPSQRMRDELKKWLDAFNNYALKIKYVRQKVDEIRKEMSDPKYLDGYIKVAGNVYPGTEIMLYDSTIPVTTILTTKRFVLNTIPNKTEGKNEPNA